MSFRSENQVDALLWKAAWWKKTEAEYAPSLVAWAGSVMVNGIFGKGSSATISAQADRLSWLTNLVDHDCLELQTR